jgi:hypothetical protein
VITLPASSFHASSSVLLAKGLVGNPSPIRPPTPVPLDQTRELELRKLDFDDYVSKIDTTLTEEQIAFVNNIKRQIKGGPKSPRSPYRDVPKPHELGSLGNMQPDLADNAEALIDWALSHAPKKAGPRKSRHKKRMARRVALKVEMNKNKMLEVREARNRRREKNLRDLKEVQRIKQEAVKINADREARLRAAGLLRERLSA